MTADDLMELWDARDTRYARRRASGRPHPVSPGEAEAIIAWRAAEAQALADGEDIRRARAALLMWAPPEVRA